MGVVLGKVGRCSAGDASPLPGGEMDRFNIWRSRLLASRPHGLDQDVLEQLTSNYGTDCRNVLRYIESDASLKVRVASDSSVIRAQVINAVREEMAQTLEDVVLRRTELGTAGHPGNTALDACAELMARELHWDRARMAQELDTVRETFRRLCPTAPEPAGVAGT